MKRILLLSICVAVFCPRLSAQNDPIARYEAFRQQAIQRYADFREKANAEYAEFMREAWEWYKGERPMPKPEPEIPEVPPVVMPEEDRDKTPAPNPQPYDEVVPKPEPKPEPKPVAPIEEKTRPVEDWVNVAIYGTNCKVRFNTAGKAFLSSTNESATADLWEQFAESNDNLVYDCLAARQRMELCDWAYVTLAERVADKIYGNAHPDEKALLQAYILCQSGFRLHIARSEDKRLHMLIAADAIMYNRAYWKFDDGNYYMIDNSNAERLAIFTQTFPEDQPMRLAITSEQKFAERPSAIRQLQSRRYKVQAAVANNENLIQFYNEYPESYANNDPLTKWRFYAQTPMCETVKKQLYPTLRNAISGKSEAEAANILDDFVQTAFVYEYDDKVWGRDRAFFAEETLYYPYSDCEDRSILFSRLVRDLLGLDVVLVYYPGHLATAVHFNENVPGDYITVNGKRYLICDPTYIGAPIGTTMPKMDNSTAKVIML